MTTFDQIIWRAPGGSNGAIQLAATSMLEHEASERWLRRLKPWLRAGHPPGRGYLDLGTQAAAIRWHASRAAPYDWDFALVLAGQPGALTGRYALELPELSASLSVPPRAGRLLPVTRMELGPGHAVMEARARSGEAVDLLVTLLARVLADEQNVTMPWPGPQLPEAVMWGLMSILSMLGDTRPVSFLTCTSSGWADDIPGLLVSFRPGAARLPSDPGFETVAARLATGFAEGPEDLRRTLRQHGLLESPDHAGRIARLLDLWPRAQTVNAHSGETQTVNADFDGLPPVTTAPPGPGTGAGRGQVVICPICLHDIDDWEALPYWRWDPGREEYLALSVPAGLNPHQRNRLVRGASVRCPAPLAETQGEHYLPVNYGLFGPPVLLGFIGLTKSGKTHLLASMVGAIERGELQDYGISSRPVDIALHDRFLDKWVDPLYTKNKELPGTPEGIVAFADAFLMRQRTGPERLVALFDVAGGDLASPDDTKYFLEIASGLFFIIDPADLRAQRLGDVTFNNVLNVVGGQVRPGPVSAAIVLNKADKVRFEEPVARWLRSDSSALDPEAFLLESADVYAFLYQNEASALVAPYRVFEKVTLHVASPTGGASEGGVYPRGVRPRRVLRPLVAMLAMTGVLTGPEAERVGV